MPFLLPGNMRGHHGDDLVPDLQITDQGIILGGPILLTQNGQCIIGGNAVEDLLMAIAKVNVLIKWLEQLLFRMNSTVRIEIGIPLLYADDVQALSADPIPPGEHFHLGIPLFAFLTINRLSPHLQAPGYALAEMAYIEG